MTAKGKKTVDMINARRSIVSDFLQKVLMVDEENLEVCTNNLEYYVPEKVLMQLVSYISFMNKCSCAKPKWKKSFEDFAQNGEMPAGCQNCQNGCNCSCCK